MKNANTSKLRNEIISIFLLSNILSIGPRAASITQELFLSNSNSISYMRYDALFIITVAAGGVYAAFSGVISATILYIIFWTSFIYSKYYPFFGMRIIPVIFVIFAVFNVVIQYFFTPSNFKWFGPYHYERRAGYMIVSGFMTGYLVCMDVACAMYTSLFSFIVFFMVAASMLVYHLSNTKNIFGCMITAYVLFFICALLTGTLCFIFTQLDQIAGYVGVLFLDSITHISINQFFALSFGHITKCPQII